jgi:hypothetical protein
MDSLLDSTASHLQPVLPSYMLAARTARTNKTNPRTNAGSSSATIAAPDTYVEVTRTDAEVKSMLLWASIVEATLWDFPAAPHVNHHVDQHNNTVYGPEVKCSEGSGEGGSRGNLVLTSRFANDCIRHRVDSLLFLLFTHHPGTSFVVCLQDVRRLQY